MDASPRPHPSLPDDPFSVRLSRSAEIAASLPQLLGFRPRESVVLVALAEPDGGRVGLTLRVDIPPEEDAQALARLLAEKVCTDDPRGAVVAVVSDDEDAVMAGLPDLPHRRLVWELVRALHALGVAVPETLLVRRDRWWSYECSRPCCDPDAGTPLPRGVTALEAAAVVSGTSVAGSREALARRIAPLPGADPVAMADACALAGVEHAEAIQATGWDATAEASWAALTAAVARCAPGRPRSALSDAEIARLVWGLRDSDVRDRALEIVLGPDAAAAEVLWTDCTRRVPSPLDAAPATLLAVSAWLRGDGAMANIALDRALRSQPGYVLAVLLAEGLARCLAPADLREMIRASLDGPADLR